MIKNGDTSTPDGSKFEMAQITKDPSTGKIKYSRMGAKEVEEILVKAKAKEEAEAEKK